MIKHQIIIIGAGLSGLSAAQHLLKNNPSLKITILQAMDRVGGRTYSKQIHGAIFDLGGMWVGPDQKYVIQLAKRAQQELIWQPHEGIKILQFAGKKGDYTSDIPKNVSIIGLIQMQYYLWKFKRMAKTVPLDNPSKCPNAMQWDSMTVYTYIHQHLYFEKVKKLTEAAVRAIFGVEPSQISLLFFLWYVHQSGSLQKLINIKDGNQQKKLIYGSQYLSLFLKKQIQKSPEAKVILNSPVDKIIKKNQKYQIITKQGIKYTADYIIIAMPPISVQRIKFQPALSPYRQMICQKNFMGSIIKLLVLYKTKFWLDKGYSGQTLSDCFDSPVFNAYDDSRPKQNGEVQPALVVFTNAAIARHWGSKEDIIQKTLQKLAYYFGDEALKPIDVHIQNWDKQQYIRGGPVGNYGPGSLMHFTEGLTKSENNIHWAGTELAYQSQGFMDGAIQSGKRAGDEILAKLNNTNIIVEEKKQQIPGYYNHITSKKYWYNYFI